MHRSRFALSLLATLAATLAAGQSHAQTFTTLASFNGPDGDSPRDGVTVIADGKTLYGTTIDGGASLGGTVFSLPITGGAPTTCSNFPATAVRFPTA